MHLKLNLNDELIYQLVVGFSVKIRSMNFLFIPSTSVHGITT